MLRSSPWPHLIVDGFLTPDVLAQAQTELQSHSYEFDVEPRGSGRIEFSLLQSATLWRAIYSIRTLSLLSDAFNCDIGDVALNKHNMLQLRRMNDRTPDFPLHNDFTSDADTIASFLYISPGWSPEYGGCLHLFSSDRQDTPSISIEPLENRFLAFRTESSHWHSVEKVAGGWERLSVLALWNLDGSEES